MTARATAGPAPCSFFAPSGAPPTRESRSPMPHHSRSSSPHYHYIHIYLRSHQINKPTFHPRHLLIHLRLWVNNVLTHPYSTFVIISIPRNPTKPITPGTPDSLNFRSGIRSLLSDLPLLPLQYMVRFKVNLSSFGLQKANIPYCRHRMQRTLLPPFTV